MNKIILTGVTLVWTLGINVGSGVSAPSNYETNSINEFSNGIGIETISMHVESPPAELKAAEKTYEQRAKALANKIMQGFIETSKLPSWAVCIAKGTKLYAGFTSQQDKEKAESITEMYLLMGKKINLDLNNQEAVFNLLVQKFDARVGQNIEAGAQYLGSSWVKKAGSCVRIAGNELYKYKLKQALNWAFTGQAKE